MVKKHKYLMDYIKDRDVYKAVMFACRMIREGEYPGKACKIAANYYGVSTKEVNYYVSQRGGRK